MANQQFCLKWNNHQGNLVSVFDSLLSSESFVDVTLACEGSNIKAHKVVLSACSPFFEELFKNNPCKHPIVIMKDMKYFDLKTIVQFMYKGEVNVSQDRLSALLKTAESLQVKGLAEVDAGENPSIDESSSTKQKQYDQPSPQPVTRKRPISPKRTARSTVSREESDRNRNTASPEIIEEVAPKKTRVESSRTISTPISSSSHYKQQSSNSSHYNQQSSSSAHYNQSYSNEPIAETYSPSTASDNFQAESQKDTFDPSVTAEEVQSTAEFQFTSGPSHILSEESNNSFSVIPDTDDKDIKDIKPSSPQVLPIQIDQEVAGRIKSPPSYSEYPEYEADNSQAYDDNSFQGQSVSYEISGDNINLDDLGAGPSNLGGDLSNTMPAGSSSGFNMAPTPMRLRIKLRSRAETTESTETTERRSSRLTETDGKGKSKKKNSRRQKLKDTDPAAYNFLLLTDAEKQNNRRKKWTASRKKEEREASRLRMQKMRERKKEESARLNKITKSKTKQEKQKQQKECEEKKKANREHQQARRAKFSQEKRMDINASWFRCI